MKTPEDILKDVEIAGIAPTGNVYVKHTVIQAMEDYAEQFKPKHTPADKPPHHGKAILIYSKINFVQIGVYSRSGKYISYNGTEVKDADTWVEIPI